MDFYIVYVNSDVTYKREVELVIYEILLSIFSSEEYSYSASYTSINNK